MANFKPAKLAYKEFEPSSGTDGSLSPIIFLHGLTGTKENWSDLPQIIADKTRRKAYAVEARNHGDSEYTDDFNFDQNADDLLHFMDEMNISKAVLVGHSMGGITSIKTALKKPERVEIMFSEDMFVKKMPKEIIEAVNGFINQWIEGVRSIPKEMSLREGIRHALNFVFSKIPADSPYSPDREKMSDEHLDLRCTPEGGYDVKYNKDVILAALKDADALASEPSGQFNGPAYFIYGSISPFGVAKEEDHIKKHFPKAELIEFEGATHTVHFEFPEKFTDAVVQRLVG